MSNESLLNSLRMTAALAIVAGSWALLFEVFYFHVFHFELYFARLFLTIVAVGIFFLSYRPFAGKYATWLVHILIVSLILSFLVTLYKIPETVFINSQLLSLLVFTIAIIFGWDAKNQIIVAIYYNMLFAVTIISSDNAIFHFPNLFSTVIFVSFISLLSVGASSLIYSMRLKFHERNEEIKFLFSNAPIGMCKLDLKGNVLTSNKCFNELFGKPEEYNSFGIDFINKIKSKKIIESTLQNGSYEGSGVELGRGEEMLYYNLSVKLITIDNKKFIELIVWDESEVKQAERARNHALKRLMEESQKRESITKKAIEQKNQKIGILAKINHEVRTPLNSILSFFELIENDMIKSPDELKDYGASVKISAENLLYTINNFIDYAKIETGHIRLDEDYFNLFDVADSVITLLNPLASTKRNELVLDTSKVTTNVLKTDGNKFRQVLINLIGNSIKYTSEGKIKVVLETFEDDEKKHKLSATVEDSGIGITKHNIDDVFKPFESNQRVDLQDFSSGLGLAICKEFIEMLGGKIWIESEHKKGTGIGFTIPVEVRNNSVT